MKIGLFAPLGNPFATPEYIATLGREAEARGFHSIWAAEHVVLFDDYASQYPYAADGKIPAGGDDGILEPFTALAYLAAVTERIRLGTGICLVPQRNPVYTAKEVAGIDWLSNGRFDFGIGVGWLKEEFDACNVGFDHRGARTREYIEVMRRLWEDPISEHHGEFYEMPALRQYPKPIQQPHPPIHIGGESDAALKRVAAFGQGWYGFNLLPEEVPAHLARLDKFLADKGRTRAEIEVSICPYLKGGGVDQVKAYADAGVDQVIMLALGFDLDGLKSTLDQLAGAIDG
jgi:probable F420-dependent oxidoreductase